MAISAAAAVLGLASIGITATPATASVYDCQNGFACGWFNGGYSGTRKETMTSISNLAVPGWNDVFSSLANRKTVNITWFTEADYWGLAKTQAPGAVADLGGTVYNDTISSVRTY